ncbi:MAG: sulfotransferase family 2 domain-containing protein [Pseudomonadota bacterium]
MSKRTVILHYHLFKNAGTSIDQILKKNFGTGWVTQEFPVAGGNNSRKVAEWIEAEPDAVAFSSHTMVGPIPKIPGVRIVTLVMLRNPLSRISSAYRFERSQDVDGFGAVLARHTSFEGYVRCRLALKSDRQCRNFQTSRLATICPGKEPELERACKGLEQFDIVGQVERFGRARNRIRDVLQQHFPNFQMYDIHKNQSSQDREDMDPELLQLLRHNNRNDFELLAHFEEMLSEKAV